jgi:hypothetical protein
MPNQFIHVLILNATLFLVGQVDSKTEDHHARNVNDFFAIFILVAQGDMRFLQVALHQQWVGAEGSSVTGDAFWEHECHCVHQQQPGIHHTNSRHLMFSNNDLIASISHVQIANHVMVTDEFQPHQFLDLHSRTVGKQSCRGHGIVTGIRNVIVHADPVDDSSSGSELMVGEGANTLWIQLTLVKVESKNFSSMVGSLRHCCRWCNVN